MFESSSDLERDGHPAQISSRTEFLLGKRQSGESLVSRAVAAAVSAPPSSTSLRRHFSLLLRHRQLWSTCLFLVFSLSLVDPLRIWRKGSSRPEKRPRKSLSRAVKHCLCDASRRQASTEHAASWAVLSSDTVDGSYSISGFRVCGTFFGPLRSTSSLLSVYRPYGRQCGLSAQWLHVALITVGQFAIANACMVAVGASRWYFCLETTLFPPLFDLEGTARRIWFRPLSQEGFWSSRGVRLWLPSVARRRHHVRNCFCVRPSVFWLRPDVLCATAKSAFNKGLRSSSTRVLVCPKMSKNAVTVSLESAVDVAAATNYSAFTSCLFWHVLTSC